MFGTGPSRGFWDWGNVAEDKLFECKKFSQIYANGKEVCEVMWAGEGGPAFVYETDEKKAFGLNIKDVKENHAVVSKKAFPDACPDHSPFCPATLDKTPTNSPAGIDKETPLLNPTGTSGVPSQKYVSSFMLFVFILHVAATLV